MDALNTIINNNRNIRIQLQLVKAGGVCGQASY